MEIPSEMENRSHDFMPCLIPKGRSHVVPGPFAGPTIQAVKEHRLRANELEIPIPHWEVQSGAIIRPFLVVATQIFLFSPQKLGKMNSFFEYVSLIFLLTCIVFFSGEKELPSVFFSVWRKTSTWRTASFLIKSLGWTVFLKCFLKAAGFFHHFERNIERVFI